MIRKNGESDAYNEATSPTPHGQEALAATDMVNEAVEEMVDEMEETFTSRKSAKERADQK